MAKQSQNENAGQVSVELDAMVCDLLDYMLDELACGEDPGVLACAEDARGGRVEAAFSDDGEEACLEAAQSFIKTNVRGNKDEGMGKMDRYAIAYAGMVRLDSSYEDAVIVSFYERGLTAEDGSPTGYSAYVLYENAGSEDRFVCSDPQPAGEEPPLI